MKAIHMFTVMFFISLMVTEQSCQILHDVRWKYLKQNASITQILEVAQLGNSVQLEYMIQMPVNKCCPILLIQTTPLDNAIIKKECYDIQPDILPSLFSLKNYLQMDWRYDTHIGSDSYHNGELFQDYHFLNNQRHYKIFGKHEVNFAEIDNAKIFALYPCFNKHHLSLQYKFSLSVKNLSTFDNTCNHFESGSPCIKYYSKWSLPNVFGQRRMVKATGVMSFLSGITSSGCHQHVMELVCRTIFPECLAKWKLAPFPCQSMCYEVFESCESEYGHFVSLSNLVPDSPPRILKGSYIDAICKRIPQAINCFHKKVNCGAARETDHGKHDYISNSSDITSVAHYTCNKGYHLEGNTSSYCQYSGKWSEPPECLVKQTFKTIIILSSMFAIFVSIVVTLFILLYKYKKDLAAILYVRLGIKFVREEEEDREFDAFIAYSQEDFDFVKNKLLDPLESMQPPFRISMRHRDFELGDWRTHNIIRSVQDSKRTIVVLSQNFINSQWCQFEFAQAHLRLLEDQSYKLLVIALQDPKMLQNTPKLIDSYIKSRTYLAKEDRLFWHKLLYQMPRK